MVSVQSFAIEGKMKRLGAAVTKCHPFYRIICGYSFIPWMITPFAGGQVKSPLLLMALKLLASLDVGVLGGPHFHLVLSSSDAERNGEKAHAEPNGVIDEKREDLGRTVPKAWPSLVSGDLDILIYAKKTYTAFVFLRVHLYC